MTIIVAGGAGADQTLLSFFGVDIGFPVNVSGDDHDHSHCGHHRHHGPHCNHG